MEQSLPFVYAVGTVAIAMLVWDTIEVGRNDAANIVNAVFGARVLRRRQAVRIAAVAVILGACFSSPVMETARKGIMDPAALGVHDALSVYIGMYLTDTVMLYSFSAFGMPVSTTQTLIFSLVGGGFALGGRDAVHWLNTGKVLLAIVTSIFIAGAAGFLVQRAFRGAIGRECDDPRRVSLHGPWIAGALLTGLVYFLLIKGLRNVGLIQTLRAGTIDVWGAPAILIALWFASSGVTWLALRLGGEIVIRHLFSGLAILGMLAIAAAFGQNDLCNSASPGVAAYMILRLGEIHYEYPVPIYLLFICGCLLAVGMATQNAQRVTRAEVNTGSQGDIVRLYAPRWCIWLARILAPRPQPDAALAPEPVVTPGEKIQHYDALRAAVITSVSASVIAFASGLKFPVSTTYVAFAAVVSTGWADRIYVRGDAHLKLGRTIWVVFSWFLSAILAAVFAGFCAKLVSVGGVVGILIGLAVNLTVRAFMKRRADQQEQRLIQEATERKKRLIGGVAAAQLPLFAADLDAEEM